MQREGFDIIVTIITFFALVFLQAPVLILSAGVIIVLYNHRLHLAAYLLLTEFGLRRNNMVALLVTFYISRVPLLAYLIYHCRHVINQSVFLWIDLSYYPLFLILKK